jgi:hypothetical protein
MAGVRRDFDDWVAEALSINREADHRITRLGNEVRDRWPEWKDQSEIFTRWPDALFYVLGITPEALRLRNYRLGSKYKRGKRS